MRGRYVFEHVMLPYLLDKRGGDFAAVLLERRGALLAALYSSACANSDDGYAEYKETDFSVDASRLTDKTVCTVIKLPAPLEAQDCKAIYILSDISPFKASFYTLELGGDGKTYLCGQEGDVRLTVKEYDGDEKSALELMLGMHNDKKA